MIPEPSRVQIFVNGQSHEIDASATIADLLSALSIRMQHCAVERNLELVPRARYPHEPLCPGDRIEIVTLVGGG